MEEFSCISIDIKVLFVQRSWRVVLDCHSWDAMPRITRIIDMTVARTGLDIKRSNMYRLV